MRSEEFITTAIWQGAVLPPSFYVRLFAMIAPNPTANQNIGRFLASKAILKVKIRI